MDTTDPDIRFDANGASHWAFEVYPRILRSWNPQGDRTKFERIIRQIKADGKGRKYDCVLGLSGGVDSSYLALLAWRNGLRPLVVHTDTGWNSEEAVHNIDRIITRCGFQLMSWVVDWEEMASLQRAFLRAGVPNQDIPQDHAIFAGLYALAARYRAKWVLSGLNYACESILPPAWAHTHRDVVHIKAINRLFGERPLRRFPLMGSIKYRLFYLELRRMQVAHLLNLIPYVKAQAIDELKHEFGWKDYGGKHYESRWTRFFQAHWLPTRFGFDKRRAHLSSMILSAQLTRDEARAKFEIADYLDDTRRDDEKFVRAKLRFTEEEWSGLQANPPRPHADFPTGARIQRLLSALSRRLGMGLREHGVAVP